MNHVITLTVDYHDEKSVIRRRDSRTAAEQVLTVPTSAEHFVRVVEEALAQVRRRKGRVVWIQESTTGWARVQELLGNRVEFILANVVQMPLPPKARRRKTDKIDTARMQREFLTGTLPRACTPAALWRQVRRLVGTRENLVARRTALRNWINRYLAHETWESRANLWSGKGQARLGRIVERLSAGDRQIIDWKRAELELLRQQLAEADLALYRVYQE